MKRKTKDDYTVKKKTLCTTLRSIRAWGTVWCSRDIGAAQTPGRAGERCAVSETRTHQRLLNDRKGNKSTDNRNV